MHMGKDKRQCLCTGIKTTDSLCTGVKTTDSLCTGIKTKDTVYAHTPNSEKKAEPKQEMEPMSSAY